MKKEIIDDELVLVRFLMICLCLLCIVFQTQAAALENKHYISPRLQLGIHTNASIDSPIIELISSGTAVEVINSDKGFKQIKTVKGTKGWVKSKFLTQEEPAGLIVKKLKQTLLQREEKILELEEKVSKANHQPVTTGLSQLKDTSKQISDEKEIRLKEKIVELKAEVKAWEQLDLQDRQALKNQAEKINSELKKRLALIAELSTGNKMVDSSKTLPFLGELPEVLESPTQSLIVKLKKNYVFLLVIGGFCFFLGIFVMDVHNRRRHGGFRV